MGLRKILTIRPDALPTTADASTWTSLAEFTVNDNCSISIEWWILGRDTSGNLTSANGNHRAKRVSAALSLVGSILYLLTINTGSDATLNTCAVRVNISGDIIQLQVKGKAATSIEWDGGMIIKQN